MPPPRSPRRGAHAWAPPPDSRSRPLAPEHLAQRPLSLPEGPLPQIVVKSPTRHPYLYRKRLGEFDKRARHGDLVRLVLPDGATFGHGLFNPRAQIAVRVLALGAEPPDEAWWAARVTSAVGLRRDVLHVEQATSAYRVVHAEADGLPGVAVDRFGDVLSIEAFSLGMYQRVEALGGLLAGACDTKHLLVRCGPGSREQEGFAAEPYGSPGLPSHVTISEHGTRFRVDFESGHKTGFFCDQRDNRRKLAELCPGKSVLDVCCYSGGFAVQAKVLGRAGEVTGVDLDERAVELARQNAKLNRAQIRFVHADAFSHMRDMVRNGRTWEVVVLDPPKLIRTRDEAEEGRRKCFDLNRLAMQLVAPGGWLLTCSCSGLMPAEEFQRTVGAATPEGRRGTILYRTGAAPDHPVAMNCPETEYLKALWLRVE
jgi:23S rRNA (cytosine1962-C5)-methyltransferase